MALNSLIPVMTGGFGMGQPVSAVLPLIHAAPHCKACERGDLHAVTHIHRAWKNVTGRVPLSTREALSTDPDVLD